MGALGRALGVAWRRSLQLRVISLTLGMSLAVILVLGFVLTSQVTNRVLDVKVRAATEQIERARNTVSGIVSGEEARSLDSSLQLARNTLTSKTDPTSGAGLAGAFDAVLVVPGYGPRPAAAAGPVDQLPDALRDFVKAGQVAYQYATVHTEGFSGPALVIGTPTSSRVTNLELYLIFPLGNEQSTIALVRGTMATGGLVLMVLLAGIAWLVTRQVVVPVRAAARTAERFAEGHLSERMPIRGEDDMARLAVSFNDMAESLSRQIAQLEEFGNLQRRFTSDVSHELRTPLTTVRMAADLIYDHSEDLEPALQRSTELMVSELDRFETLLNDLLEISRHDAGVAELSVEAVDLRATVNSALGNVGHLAEDAGVQLIVDMPPDEVIAEVDPRRVERILRNLIANAIDHAEHKPVRIRMAADEDTVAVTVRDYGVGLRPGEEKLVFSRFWRSDPSRVRQSGGTGLGLAISVEDARLHQGRLEAWGEPGQGACFRLTLPLVRGHKVTTSPLPMKPIAPERNGASASAAGARRKGRVMRRLAGLLFAVAVVLAGCAGVPSASAPQAIGTVERPAPSNLPKPTPGMDPDMLLREFLKATADPANRHLAARQFLTQSASNAWDDAGSALLIDHVVFVETHSSERVSVTMRADKLGSLSDMGVFETAEGVLPDPGPIELIKTPGGWRIDRLPNGVFLDWQQFQATYKRNTLYFADPTGKTVVPDPRYVAVADRDQLATELISKLIAGPRPEMAKSVRNMLGPPLRLRGPVTRADGGKSGIGRGYAGARIDLELLTVADPHSKQLLAAQIIWTLARADIKGPYVINADGAALDERFAAGWNPSDVAATDPGVAEGAAAGVHALVGGRLVSLNGQASDPVPGAFGRTTDQTGAALSRSGHQVASVVTLRPGAPDMASSLWIGDLGGEAVEAADGHTLSRPSWSLDDAVWVVADGNTVLRAIAGTASGQPARLPVDSAAVSSRFPGVIAELQLSRDGTRAAMVIEGQVILASVEQTQAGQFALTYPRRLGFGLGSSVVSLSWRADDDIAVSRNDAEHPVSYVNIDGVNSDAPNGNLQLPVGAIAANPSMVYVADPRGVMQLSISGAEGPQGWLDVPPFMVAGAVPVMPG